MGTATLEISSDNEINENAHKPPEFYPCDDCGRMFTKLALRIHKRYCTENIEHCICFVCHLTRLRLRTGDIVAFNSSKNGQNDVYRKFVDRLKQTLNENKVEDPPKKNSNNAEKRILPWNENISYLHISPKIDASSENISEEKAIFNNNNTKYFLKSGHGCNSCSRKLFCNFCKEHVYWHLYGLHILRHTKKIEGDQIVCPECSALHSSAAYFLSHYYSHINLHPKDCTECHCRFSECVQLVSIILNPKKDRCYICLEVFENYAALVDHIKIHTELLLTCPVCDKVFRQVGNFTRHITAHSGQKPHKCPRCSKSFADPATLRNHLRVHTKETPYVCEKCNRGFSQVGNLKRHLALHVEKKINSEDDNSSDSNKEPPNKEPPNKEPLPIIIPEEELPRKRQRKGPFQLHECEECGKKYAWAHDLSVHSRIHTGERPHKCDLCGKRFAQSGAVRIHKLRHHSLDKSCKELNSSDVSKGICINSHNKS